MKKSILIFVFVLAATITFSQDKKDVIGINEQYNPSDTTRSFSILGASEFDDYINKLKKYFGTPVMNGAGTIKWSNVDIPGLSSGLKVELTDGIITKENGDMKYELFKDKDDKEKKLKKIKPNQLRNIEIIITDNTGINFINTKTKTDIVKRFLENVVK